jgi:hypothetical protein
MWTLFFIIVSRAAHVYPLMAWVSISFFCTNFFRSIGTAKRERKKRIDDPTSYHTPLNTWSSSLDFEGLSLMHVRTSFQTTTATGFFFFLDSSQAFREIMICTTMIIALLTIFIKGGATVKMLEILGIQRDVDPGPYVEKVPFLLVEFHFRIAQKTS